ncbi:EAL domain-containing protein [Pseudomonas stutzeri]|nr:EAL domain-containing protein [Stutzerimonas stutzeri]
MSLFKQLFVAVCVLMLASFAGSMLIGVESSREQQVAQLRTHAQDTATALGLSLAPHISDDLTMVELMVSSVFDSGYFESIRVLAPDSDAVLVERSGTPVTDEAPQWFVRLVGLDSARGDAIVSDGWRRAARVEVVSHPLFAVGKLWRSALGNLLWQALLTLVCIVLGGLLLKRRLRPLDYMVEQSQAIARREFLTQTELPSTPEFRRVVQAMNQMVDKLRSLFAEEAARSEKLRDEAYRDRLTGLANRRYFDLQLHACLAGEERASSGFLLQLEVDDLIGLNRRLGEQRTDRLLKSIAEQLQQLSGNRMLVARHRGGRFLLLGAGLQRSEAEQLAQRLEQSLGSLQQTGACDRLPVAHIGLVAFTAGDQAADLQHALDLALTEAQTQPACHWAIHEPGTAPTIEDPHRYWHDLLERSLSDGRLQLHFQPVVDAREPSRILHHKVLARVHDENGRVLAAGHFLPWLERFGWSARLDLVMLERTLQQLRGNDLRLALSLSHHLLHDPQALDRLYRLLEESRELTTRLTLELDENQLPDPAALEALTRRLRRLGCGLGLQHFGGRFSMIGNLARLGLSYLKVDGSYIRAIDRESDKRLFIDAMQRAANSIDLPLLAERVETTGEWQVLRDMGIAGVQGHLFGAPAAELREAGRPPE